MIAGQTVSHYRILRKIGQGGLGEVFLAEDTILKRQVALKFLSDQMSRSPDLRARLLAEARSAASIDHPFVCKVYEAGESDGQGFIALEFVAGQTLGERLDGGPLPFSEALTVITQLAEGIAAAHEHEIVHGDIKPANVMISQSGHVKIMDFGLATRITERSGSDETGPKSQHEGEGALLGTPAYMSPEQIRGEWADARSDVFSMGLVYFQILSGVHPFRKRTPQATMAAIVHEQTPALNAAVPIELIAIVNRMLGKEPAGRYSSSREVLEDLKRFRHFPPISDARPAQRTIAILPFLNLSPDPNQDYFCDGLAEELITALSNLEGLRVASRTSSFSFRGSNADVREVGERLKVEAILEGSVRKAGDRVRIVVKLVAVSSGYPLWSERYDRQFGDIFEIQDEITRAVLEKLRLPDDAGATRVAKPSTSSMRAYELYLKGRFYWNKRTEENLKKSINYFDMALTQDPHHTLSLAGRADAYVTLALYGALPPAEVMPRANESAEKALAQAPEMPEALTALATIHAVYNWNWAAGERTFKRAIKANPNYAGAHHWYAIHCLAPAGRFEEARAAIRQALELDPLSLVILTTSGLELYFERDYDAAIQEYRKALDLDPNFGLAHYFLGQACLQKGAFDEAIDELERAVHLTSRSPESVAVLGYAYAVIGNLTKAGELAGELEAQAKSRYVSPVLPAWIHLGLGEHDMAFHHLHQAYQDRATDLIWLRVRPAFDAIRSDPRFDALCNRVGL